MIAAPLAQGVTGVDLDTLLTVSSCSALLALDRPNPRIAFVVRYLGDSPGDLTVEEASTITSSGLALLAVTHPRCEELTAALGSQDGAAAAARARAVGYPQGAHVFLDLEEWTGDAMGYVDSWASLVRAAGFIPALYVGFAVSPLTPTELYSLGVDAYWHSVSDVPDVAIAGFVMYQLDAPDQELAGLEVDLNAVQRDRKGRLPVAAWSTREAPTMPGRKSSSSSLAAVRG